MTITVATLAAAIGRADDRMKTLEAELNAADAKLGDGDTGAMLARLIGALAAVDLSGETELGKAFMALAKAGAASTGSSLGTLVVTALMTAGKATAGKSELSAAALGPLFGAIRDAAMARGKAELGSKTIVDSLDYLASSLAGSDAGSAGATAVAATAAALADFRDRSCTMGRARMFAEKSIGLDDPGMLALAELTRAVARA
jgi:dihydroxyacetone kinase/dihydroxyacetone kinase-like protein